MSQAILLELFPEACKADYAGAEQEYCVCIDFYLVSIHEHKFLKSIKKAHFMVDKTFFR